EARSLHQAPTPAHTAVRAASARAPHSQPLPDAPPGSASLAVPAVVPPSGSASIAVPRRTKRRALAAAAIQPDSTDTSSALRGVAARTCGCTVPVVMFLPLASVANPARRLHRSPRGGRRRWGQTPLTP